MKKIILFILCACMIITTVSCEKNSPFDIASNILDATEMSKEEYNEVKIEQFENRFSKIDIKDSVLRLVHYKSKTEYAILIEFKSEEKAKLLYDFISPGLDDISINKNVVVYGDCEHIKGIFQQEAL